MSCRSRRSDRWSVDVERLGIAVLERPYCAEASVPLNVRRVMMLTRPDRVPSVDPRSAVLQISIRSTAAAGMEFRSTAAGAPTPEEHPPAVISTRVRVTPRLRRLYARAAVGAVRRASVCELEVRRVALLGQGLEELADGHLATLPEFSR